MKKLQPLAVLDVGLAAGHVLDVPGVDQADLDAAVLQNLKERNPVNAGGLHCDGDHTARHKPVGQSMQVFGEGGELAHRRGSPVGWNRCVDHGGTDIDAAGVGPHGGQAGLGLYFFGTSHRVKVAVAPGAARTVQRKSNLLNGMTGLQKQAGLTNDPSTRFGTTLTIGLLDEHHWHYGVQLACRERSQLQPIRSAPFPQVSLPTAPASFAGLVANQALQHNDPSCHVSCLRTPRASRGRG